MGLIFKEGFSFSGFERDHLYLNLQGSHFKDISGVSGIDSISDGRSAVLADFDNDGDLDVFLTAIQNEGHLLFRNNVGQDNRFMRVTLEGTTSGKDAFGTKVRVKTSQGVQMRIKSGGEGFLAQHDPRLLFGLGKEESAEWVEVTWPSGKVTRFGSVAAGKSLKVVEGKSEYETLTERLSFLPDPVGEEEQTWKRVKLTKGGAFPQLKIKPLEEGKKVQTVSLEPGVSYFINLWATWCGPCRKEMPELQKLLPQFKAKGIQLIGLSLDQGVDAATIKAFAQELGVTYPLYLLDESSFELIFGELLFVPLSILIDPEGRAVDLFEGWGPESESRIRKWLK